MNRGQRHEKQEIEDWLERRERDKPYKKFRVKNSGSSREIDRMVS